MKTSLRLLIFLLLGVQVSHAQQDSQFTQYMFNKLYFNPATAGVEHEFNELTVIHRSQWAGYNATFDDGASPTTQSLTFSMPFPIKEGKEFNPWGLGLSVVNDNFGHFGIIRAKLGVAYHLETKAGKLSFGLSSGIDNVQLDGAELRFVESDDPLDDQTAQSDSKLDLDFGVYFNSASYFVGVAATGLLGAEYDLLGNGATKSGERALHGNVMAGYIWDVNGSWEIQPSALLKYAESENFSYEATLMGTYQDKYYLGLGYRDSDAVMAMLGVNLLENGKLRIGYAFDYTTQGLNAKEQTSHEVRVSYRMPAIVTKVPSIIRSPRFKQF